MDKTHQRLTRIFVDEENAGPPGPSYGKALSRIVRPTPPPNSQAAGKLRKNVHFATAIALKHPEVAQEFLEARPGTPWKGYQEVYTWHDLGGDVLLAITKSPEKRVNIRLFPAKHAEQSLYWFRHVRHKSFVAAREAFTTDDFLYVVLEEMDITLSHVIACSKYPDQQELGAILGQVGVQESNLPKPTR